MGVALLYALAGRLLFADQFPFKSWQIVSLSFLIVFPFCFGALTTWLGCRFFGRSRFWIFAAPGATLTLGFFASWLSHLEALFCLVVAYPIMLPLAHLGGFAMGKWLSRGSGKLYLTVLVFAPYLVSPVEQLWERPHRQVTVVNTVEIEAPPENVWKEIASVRAIDSNHVPSSLIYSLDFPKPISAEIDAHALGARRLAKFERGVTFFETVTAWNPPNDLAFTIEADPDFIPHTAFDQHIVVGGRFFDVLDGRYRVETMPDGSTRLHLTSTHRLSTPFNAYAGSWSQWVMHEIQESILTVILQRAERAALAQDSPD